MFKEHEQIVLTADVRGDGGVELKRGDVGAIVHIHPGGKALVVEFIALDGDTLAIATVLPSQAPDRGMYLVFPASGWQIIFGSASGPGRGSGSNKTLLPIGLVPS